MRTLRFLAHTVFGLILCVSLVGGGAVWGARDATALSVEPGWLWPLSGEHSIRLDYQAPLTEYSPGHRGIDLVADLGQEVRAPTAGIISYAGTLAGRGVLTLRAGTLQLSFEAITPSVSEGDEVPAGAVIGHVAPGTHCDECLHFGVRRNGLYLSPLTFLEHPPLSRLEMWDDAHWARLAP